LAKTFVGIGFGPIQSGLFLLEAHKSGGFDRYVVAEIDPGLVASIRTNAGRYSINVACANGIALEQVSGVEPFLVGEAEDQRQLVAAIAEASEIATALPSIAFFRRGSPSPAALIARGLRRKLESQNLPAAIVYAAENHNSAAELLREAVACELSARHRERLGDRVQFVNTVIGKMSGLVTDENQIRGADLAPLVEGGKYAVLVEEFNKILIDQVALPAFDRGIHVFEEKPDLLPFEEAKLYGHNAAHALLGYLANHQGCAFLHESDSRLVAYVEQAFVEESGTALCERHAGVDPLFSHAGWQAYVRDLLQRMTNPYLADRVDRVIRDPRRKLGWNDRIIGTMRLALDHKVVPSHYAVGAALAVDNLLAGQSDQRAATLLNEIWLDEPDNVERRKAIVALIDSAGDELRGNGVISNARG
jgi:mannitol-1-phosphate 5-dehydrogenase